MVMMQAPQRSADDVATVARYRPVEELIPRLWSVGDVEANGIRQHYIDAGSGPVIVMIHGIAGSAGTWVPVMPLLAEKYTVIAPDLLGHGESAKPRGDYSLGAIEVSGLTFDVARFLPDCT